MASNAVHSTVPSPSLPRPLQLVDSNIPPSAITSPCATQQPMQSHSPLSSPPFSPTFRRPLSANPRRQSSISYISSDHARIPDLRSPTSPSSFTFGKPAVRRSNSLGVRGVGQGEPKLLSKRNSLMSGVEPSSPGPTVDRGPLTLTEKHADLLQFIAQKEAKCLELRSQLATHEAELKDLKRKWERIVSRGVDRAYTPASTSVVSPPPSSAPMLEGIKEGVQEVGRLLAAGLDLSSNASAAPDAHMVSSPANSSLSALSRANLPLAMRRARHIAAQSVSSVSTSATSVSRGTTQRLSQSSASSIEEIDESKPTEADEDVTQTAYQPPMDDVLVSPSTESHSTKLIRRRSRDAGKIPSPLSASSPSVSSPEMPAKQNPLLTKQPSALPMATLAQPVSSWVGSVGSSVGKRWEDIQKTETFSRSQKRASVLISDVSQSIFAALGSHSPSTMSPPPARASISISTNPFLATLSPLSAKPSSVPSPSSNTSSLIEEDLLGSPWSGSASLGDVLVPTQSKVTQPSPTKTLSAQKSLLDDDDDDWNW